MKVTAPPVDLDHILESPTLLEKLRKRVKKIGIELEGGWDRLPDGVGLTRDSSVVFEAPLPSERERELYTMIQNGIHRYGTPEQQAVESEYLKLQSARTKKIPRHSGEFPSVPLEIKDNIWETWMRTNYPPHVNATCGMHIHMSFNNDFIYQRLMDESLTSTIIAYVKKWAEVNLPTNHHIYPRLEGKSEYCQHLFHAESQVKIVHKRFNHFEPGHRYTVMNYPHAQHRTVECRLLPMMPTVDLGISAIQMILNVTNAYLATQRKREEPIKVEVPIDDVGFLENFHLSL